MAVADLSSRPAQAVLSIVKGDAWRRTLRFRKKDGSPLDLTGSTLLAAMYVTLGGEKLFDVPVTLVGAPTAGDASIELSEALSGSLTAGVYSDDPAGTYQMVVKKVDSLDDMRTLMQVKVLVLPG